MTSPDLKQSGIDASSRLDLRGLNCPLPVLKTRRRLATMSTGDTVLVETTDPLAAIDIPAYCSDNGHRLVRADAVDGGHTFLIEKGATAA